MLAADRRERGAEVVPDERLVVVQVAGERVDAMPEPRGVAECEARKRLRELLPDGGLVELEADAELRQHRGVAHVARVLEGDVAQCLRTACAHVVERPVVAESLRKRRHDVPDAVRIPLRDGDEQLRGRQPDRALVVLEERRQRRGESVERVRARRRELPTPPQERLPCLGVGRTQRRQLLLRGLDVVAVEERASAVGRRPRTRSRHRVVLSELLVGTVKKTRRGRSSVDRCRAEPERGIPMHW